MQRYKSIFRESDFGKKKDGLDILKKIKNSEISEPNHYSILVKINDDDDDGKYLISDTDSKIKLSTKEVYKNLEIEKTFDSWVAACAYLKNKL